MLVSYFFGSNRRVCFGKRDVSFCASFLHLCDGDCFGCESLYALDCLWKKEAKRMFCLLFLSDHHLLGAWRDCITASFISSKANG